MRKDFVQQISAGLGINRADLVEKDVILHELLTDLSGNKFFRKNFVFKGGTCLIKHYLGYYRFSEDIDFTWRDQTDFWGKSSKQVRRGLSKVLDEAGAVFEEVALKRGLRFTLDKSDPDNVELGGSNRMASFKLKYDSEVLGIPSFVKIQTNFVEKMFFPVQAAGLKSLVSGRSLDRVSKLFPESYAEYAKEISFGVYGVREILAEKIRAILTRRGFKERDFWDAYLICQREGLRLEDIESAAVGKVAFTLSSFERYRKNFGDKRSRLKPELFFSGKNEEALLLKSLDKNGFNLFLPILADFLEKVTEQTNPRVL